MFRDSSYILAHAFEYMYILCLNDLHTHVCARVCVCARKCDKYASMRERDKTRYIVYCTAPFNFDREIWNQT